jgi:DNA-binding NarL/FixJ family response regulator
VLVLELLACGYTFVQIGNELGCDPNTARGAAKRMFVKMGAENKCHAISIAYQRGILKIHS